MNAMTDRYPITAPLELNPDDRARNAVLAGNRERHLVFCYKLLYFCYAGTTFQTDADRSLEQAGVAVVLSRCPDHPLLNRCFFWFYRFQGDSGPR